MVVLIRAHFHFSFLIGGGEGTNGIKLNVTFFTPVGLRRNNSRTLQATVNTFTLIGRASRREGLFISDVAVSFIIKSGEATNGIKLNMTYITPVDLRENNARKVQGYVNFLNTKERGRKTGDFN